MAVFTGKYVENHFLDTTVLHKYSLLKQKWVCGAKITGRKNTKNIYQTKPQPWPAQALSHTYQFLSLAVFTLLLLLLRLLGSLHQISRPDTKLREHTLKARRSLVLLKLLGLKR